MGNLPEARISKSFWSSMDQCGEILTNEGV